MYQYNYPYYYPEPPKNSQPQNNPIIWVQGEPAARAYMVAAGNTVLLMDSEKSSFYLKSTDGSGMPQPLRIFDYTERGAQPAPEYVTRAEFMELKEKILALEGGND